jgi:hypothetical protein
MSLWVKRARRHRDGTPRLDSEANVHRHLSGLSAKQCRQLWREAGIKSRPPRRAQVWLNADDCKKSVAGVTKNNF